METFLWDILKGEQNLGLYSTYQVQGIAKKWIMAHGGNRDLIDKCYQEGMLSEVLCVIILLWKIPCDFCFFLGNWLFTKGTWI